MPPTRPLDMRLTGILGVALAAALLVATPALAAQPCFTVYDRQGDIVYRDFVPPYDSALDFTSPGREATRRRGEHFVFFEADFCVPVSGAGVAGGRAASTDEVVAGFRSYAGATGSIAGVTYGSGDPRPAGGVAAPVPSGAPMMGGPAARITAPAAAAVQNRAASYR